MPPPSPAFLGVGGLIIRGIEGGLVIIEEYWRTFVGHQNLAFVLFIMSHQACPI
jgi:hypothetical protein